MGVDEHGCLRYSVFKVRVDHSKCLSDSAEVPIKIEDIIGNPWYHVKRESVHCVHGLLSL